MANRDTQFKPGQSGNPNGRPRGIGAKIEFTNRILNEPNKEAIANKLMEMAMEGNEMALKFLGERMFLRPQDNVTAFALKQQINEKSLLEGGEDVVRQVADGEMLNTDATLVNNLLKSQIETITITKLMEKLSDLQAKVDAMGNK